jgi:drug/metabolite transporter (DMT)-like permease
MILASALFAVNGTVSKLILRTGMDAPQLTTLRVTGAAVGLLVLCLMVPPGRTRLRVRRREVPGLVAYGVAGVFFVQMLYFVGISRLPVGITLLFEYTAPLLVALWARFGQHQRVKPRLWLGLAASLVGLAGVAEFWGDLRLDPLGVTASLGAAVLLTIYYVLGAKGVTRRDPLSLTTLAFGAAAVAGALIRPWWDFPYGLMPRFWPLVIYVVLGGSISPYLLTVAALKHLPPTSVGILAMIEPVIATAVAWSVLGERLDAVQLAGGVLILLGVALAETARTVGPDEAPEFPPG